MILITTYQKKKQSEHYISEFLSIDKLETWGPVFNGADIMFVSKETKLKNKGRKMSIVDSEACQVSKNITGK